MRVAAIDCGTNSIRLLIADVDLPGSGSVTDVVRRMTVVRLGEGVDTTGEFSPQALERTFAAVEDYAELIRRHRVEQIRFVATSASRDVTNREEFFAGVHQRLSPLCPDFAGPEVIRGSEEAGLSFAGAASVLDWDPEKKVLVVDLGGGSTEFVLGTPQAAEHAISTDMGCVRFTERHMRSDPPQETECSMAAFETLSFLEDVSQVMPLHETETVIGVAGTVTTVAAHALGLEDYDAEAIHGAELDLDTIQQSVDQLVNSTREQRAAMPFMHPGRVDVIGAGALIWGTILDYLNKHTGGRVTSAIASEHDILDGIAMSMAARIHAPAGAEK
ncbi:Ppx/GppA phosphatase family protein [Nesterenkonia sp.]|uniref:Ppx/GppA phosphatase family protein n=1 Tax=Nesterenkonia sp. TaxID=704201 RepID=UPI00262FBF9C|nr:Ppx/GppA phosphatase family protein [Nesterenkonia sp.]